MAYILTFLSLLITLFFPPHTWAKGFKIAAIVNETVISNIDVDERTKLVMVTTGLPATSETQAKIRGQVLSSMIDEALKLQEAQRFSYSISEQEKKQAIAMLTQQRKITHPEGIIGALAAQGISQSTFAAQLEGEILWNKVIRDHVARNVSISEDDISRAQQQIINSVQEEVNIAALVLPVTTPEDEPRVAQLANSIASDVKDAQSFAAIAAQLGQQGLRSVRPQWVPVGRLDPIYKKAITNLEAGQVSKPARTPNGYEILLYNGTRERTAGGDSELYIKRVTLPLEKNETEEDVQAMLEITKHIASNPGDCFTPTVAGLDDVSSLGISIDFARTKLSAMPAPIRKLATTLKVNKISAPFPSPDGIQMLMVCERIDLPPPLPDAEKVKQVLFEEKLALETQKYLRNLRRNAFIEKRDE